MVKGYLMHWEKMSRTENYNSHNTVRLDVDGMQKLLLKLEFMQVVVSGEHVSLEEQILNN